MQMVVTRPASDSGPKQEAFFNAGRDEHLTFKVFDDKGVLVFEGVIWNRPVMLGVTTETDMIIKPVDTNSITIKRQYD